MTDDKLAALGLIGLLGKQGDFRSLQLQHALQWHFLASTDRAAIKLKRPAVYTIKGGDNGGLYIGDLDYFKSLGGQPDRYVVIPIDPPPAEPPPSTSGICKCCGQALP